MWGGKSFSVLFALLCLMFLAGCLSEPSTPETEFLTNEPVAGETATKSAHGDKPKETALTSEKGITTAEIDYFEGARGFLARPSAPGIYPGVVMIHEWWGLNDNVRNEAQKLAREGYVVLAVDLYYQNSAQTPEEARALVGSFDQERGIINMLAAKDYLLEVEKAPNVASLGWCFGGGQSLQLSLNADLVTDKDELRFIDWPVLGIFASEDQGIPVSVVREFEAALNELGVVNEIHVYEGADHAFANPSGERYNAAAADDAWEKTLAFLDKNL